MNKSSSLDESEWPTAPAEMPEEVASRSRSLRFLPVLVSALAIGGIILPHVLIGGARLFFSLPGYLLIGLAAVLAGVLAIRRTVVGPRVWPLFSTLAFAGYVIARSYTSPIEYLARTDRFMAMGALLVYLLTAFCITTPKQRLGAVIAFLVLAVADVACGIRQFVRIDNFMLLGDLPDGYWIPSIFRADYGARASGFLGCPNHLAGFLEMLGLVALSVTCLGRLKAVPRLLFGGAVALCFTGLAFTGSRGGYLSTSVGTAAFMILVIWIVKKLRPKKFLVITMVGVIAVSAMFAVTIIVMSNNAILGKRMGEVIDTENMRKELWASANRQFEVAPAFGTGSGTYLYYGRQFRDPSVQNDPVHVHNDYLELLCEYGTVGVILAGILILTHIHSAWRGVTRLVRKRLRPAKRLFSTELAITVGALAAFIALLAHSVVDFNGHVPANTLFFAFILGILCSPSCDTQVLRKTSPMVMKSARVAIPVMGIAVIAVTAPLLAGEYHAEWARVQLRCKEYTDVSSRIYQQISRGLPALSTDVIWPDEGSDRRWPIHFAQTQLLPRALAFAENGIRQESKNPDLFYYLGEIRHLQSLYSAGNAGRELIAASALAYEQGLRLFPTDVRLMLRLGRAFDNLGMADRAGEYLTKAIAADPNASHVYACYGYHLWRQKKLARAEAYYRKALSLHGNEVALAGMEDIAFVRRLAANPEYVELHGDPLENYDLDPPDESDAKRGLRIDD